MRGNGTDFDMPEPGISDVNFARPTSRRLLQPRPNGQVREDHDCRVSIGDYSENETTVLVVPPQNDCYVDEYLTAWLKEKGKA